MVSLMSPNILARYLRKYFTRISSVALEIKIPDFSDYLLLLLLLLLEIVLDAVQANILLQLPALATRPIGYRRRQLWALLQCYS